MTTSSIERGHTSIAAPLATAVTATADTFPKLLLEQARIRGTHPAIREKDFGIWQSWSWAEVLQNVRLLAGGFAALGMRRGDRVAIIGDNRSQR